MATKKQVPAAKAVPVPRKRVRKPAKQIQEFAPKVARITTEGPADLRGDLGTEILALFKRHGIKATSFEVKEVHESLEPAGSTTEHIGRARGLQPGETIERTEVHHDKIAHAVVGDTVGTAFLSSGRAIPIYLEEGGRLAKDFPDLQTIERRAASKGFAEGFVEAATQANLEKIGNPASSTQRPLTNLESEAERLHGLASDLDRQIEGLREQLQQTVLRPIPVPVPGVPGETPEQVTSPRSNMVYTLRTLGNRLNDLVGRVAQIRDNLDA